MHNCGKTAVHWFEMRLTLLLKITHIVFVLTENILHTISEFSCDYKTIKDHINHLLIAHIVFMLNVASKNGVSENKCDLCRND